jgi:hypothetical protein
MNPALYQLLETYYKKRRLTLIITVAICAVIMFVGVGWGIASYVDDPPSWCGKPKTRAYAACKDRYYRDVTSRTAVLGGLPGIVLIIAGIGLIPLRDLSQAPLIRAFTSRKEEVAWIYPKRTSVRRYGVEVNQIHEVVVCTTDGKRILLAMSESDVQASIRMMAAEAPRAATGFSEELERRFLGSPASVMKTNLPTLVSRVAAPPSHLCVAPDVPFASIDQGIRYLGYASEPAPRAPAPMPGEVLSAVWSGKGTRIVYSFDPGLYLRLLEITGGDPKQLAGELAGVVNVPVLGAQQITGLLASVDSRTLLLGLRAAEAVGATADDRRPYQDLVTRLAAHPDPAVAQAAQQVSRGWA